jgi:murein DD-endopeptidase MepM/ murein hydrolase activator NlpD
MITRKNNVKRRLFLSLVLLSVIGISAFPSIPPARAGGVVIALEFQWIKQGGVGLVRATGSDIAEMRAVFQERLYYFYPEGDGFIGMIAADIEEQVGTYPMQVWVRYNDDTTELIDQDVDVTYGEFGTSQVLVPASLAPLLDPATNQAEMDKLSNILERFTPERYWTGGFIVPTTLPIEGYFGATRLYNETYWYQHTGSDYPMAEGTSVVAAANGRVILSQMMSIRGGYILIDHGWGIYSGYAHLSERFVVPGEWVRQGQVIALSGKNGRSSGAHLHWEIAVGGAWVNPEDFQAMGFDVAKEQKPPAS